MKAYSKYLFFHLLVSFIFFSCKNEDFVEKKDIKKFKETDFVVSLEQNFSENKNQIYASSLLYAWNALQFNEIETDKTTEDFHQLITSKSFLNSLDKDDIDIDVNRSDSLIYARAFFKKNLPFQREFDYNNSPIIFDNVKTKSFGFYGSNFEKKSQAEILYYKDDDNFIIKLIPIDNNQEIIIIKKREKNYNNFREIISQYEIDLKTGRKEKFTEKDNWQYIFNESDEVRIPEINFNIEKLFESISGISFREKNKLYSIEMAKQSIAFLLNNKGAKVESEAILEVATDAGEENNLPKPKNFILDKPFTIILKQENSKNPYFACYINNSELLVKN
ncbi:hypothetical protein V3Q90_05585 [Flavobacterium oreochromis]|uniref:Serpin domain-containing protein n=1 Tax=Flavobacterium oreochromis TaxID=2906078 RepID=A0ABW8P6V2_9FLAO|nr:hypothetical protein [Flavobacterium oreochromis]OWP77914.1 hypothetical protein BWG23_03830 [Flavobacterium oreochromis]